MTVSQKFRGPIAWMTKNSVAANLLMVCLIVGGIMVASRAKQEVFPEFVLEIVTITVPYPGASPAEVEQGILFAIEESVRGVDNVKRVTSVASEGSGTVVVELILNTNSNKALQDIKNAVDRITSFPQDAERPIVSLVTNQRDVISMIIYGDLDEHTLRGLAEHVREDLLKNPKITLVELAGVRPPEIGIEVPQARLRAYGLTLEEVAREVSRSAVELPGGGVKTESGEILLRTAERRDYGQQFADIPILSNSAGTDVRLGDIAEITDGFRDIDVYARYNDKPAVRIEVFRQGKQAPIEIAEIVRAYVEDFRKTLPPGVDVATWGDRSIMYSDRIDLLLRNAYLGLSLVLLTLGLFLEVRLAFWVTMGIPISFLGSFLLVPVTGVSINMISLFAFIVSLGIVVDDAIVVGENIYEYRQKGLDFLQAAIEGTRNVSVPVTFSILTNVTAFMPLFFVPGIMGKFFRVIPSIVVAVLLISLVESLFVLPAHLGHQKPPKKRGFRAFLFRQQQKVSQGISWAIRTFYGPVLRLALQSRYLTVAIGLSILLMAVGYVAGGHLNFTFMPRVDTDVVAVSAVLPFGSPVSETEKVQERLYETALEVLERHGGKAITRGIFAQIGRSLGASGPGGPGGSNSGSHTTNIQVYMVATEERSVTASQIAQEWRIAAGDIAGLESLLFHYTTGPSAGNAIDVELSHPDIEVLEVASAELAEGLLTFAGVKDINDGFEQGKPQFDMTIRPEARSLGVTATDMGRQVRNAFYGARAFRQQRGRDEIWVMVRLPEEERESEYDIEELVILANNGGEIPLTEAVNINRGRAYTVINRRDGRRVVNVTADVELGVANAGNVLASLQERILPELLERHAGLQYSLEGEQREQRETLSSLSTGFLLAQIGIFALLAIPFKSYIQPLVVMTAIPFGMIGAIAGHIIMGYDLSIISMMGIVALTGVVVNDSLVLIVAANSARDKGHSPLEAITAAGVRRFRPILLTSLTTFFGLAPMIFETSVQARFLIPMAISLGYGVLFATVIVLLLVPALYIIVEDWKRGLHSMIGGEM